MSSTPAADVAPGASWGRPWDGWYAVSRSDGVVTTVVGATAERTVDLWHALASSLDPAVDVYLRDVRRARAWHGNLLPLPDVRDALGRLRLSLAAYGGVECALFTAEDQLTLTPELVLVLYSRTERWSFLLDGYGVVERATPPTATWHVAHDALSAAPALSEAVDQFVARVSLTEGAS